MRRFVVIGLGNFGMGVALGLARLGQKVTAVDADPDKARDAQAEVDQALVADATDRDTLAAMGIAQADTAVVSLGGHLDASILAVLHLSHLGVREILAKALTPEHAEILSRVGATRVIFPEKETARRVALRLSSRGVLDYLTLDSEFSVLELAPSSAMVGKTLAELDLGRTAGVQVLAVRELVPERVLIAPDGGQVVKDSDILVVLGTEDSLRKLQES